MYTPVVLAVTVRVKPVEGSLMVGYWECNEEPEVSENKRRVQVIGSVARSRESLVKPSSTIYPVTLPL